MYIISRYDIRLFCFVLHKETQHNRYVISKNFIQFYYQSFKRTPRRNKSKSPRSSTLFLKVIAKFPSLGKQKWKEEDTRATVKQSARDTRNLQRHGANDLTQDQVRHGRRNAVISARYSKVGFALANKKTERSKDAKREREEGRESEVHEELGRRKKKTRLFLVREWFN